MLNIIPIPGEITEYLKREIGDPTLELVWMPDEARVNKRFRFNSKDTGKGCFGVCKWVNQCIPANFDGVPHYRTERVPYVTPLDGNHGKPLVPGRWLVEMYVESDVCRRGMERIREVDDWREGKVVQELKDRDRMASDYAHNDLMYNAMKRVAEEMGTETPTREEMVAIEKRVMERAQAMEDKDQADRKTARFYSGKTQEELL